jgi:hypothetical protein
MKSSLPLPACLSNSSGAVCVFFVCRNGRPLLFTRSVVSLSLLVSGARELVIFFARGARDHLPATAHVQVACSCCLAHVEAFSPCSDTRSLAFAHVKMVSIFQDSDVLNSTPLH